MTGPITIYNVETHESIKIDLDRIKTLIGREYSNGDDIIISTVSGDKYVQVLHDGKYTNAISAIGETCRLVPNLGWKEHL